MTVFSSTDWNRKSGDIFEAARRGPVTITQRKRPAFVVMSYEAFQRLLGQRQTAFTLEDAPDDVHDALMRGLDAIVEDEPSDA